MGSRGGPAIQKPHCALIFDLDSTLCTAANAKAEALARLLPTDEPSVLAAATQAALSTERDLRNSRAEIHVEVEIVCGMFKAALPLLAQSNHVDPESLAREYIAFINHNVRFASTIPDILAEANAARIKVGILSNGAATSQRDKLKAIASHRQQFDAIHISEECGVAKPNPLAYHCIAADLRAHPRNCVMIGDNRTNDYLGPTAVGMHATLIAPLHEPDGDRRLLQAARSALAHLHPL